MVHSYAFERIERKENISVLKATEHDISSNQLKTRKKTQI